MIGDIVVGKTDEEAAQSFERVHYGNVRVEKMEDVWWHRGECPHRHWNNEHAYRTDRKPECTDQCGFLSRHKLVMYEGCVIAKRERNGYNDSDFYAIVWDEKNQTVRSVEYATTRFACGSWADVDATPEVLEKAREDYERKYRESLARQYKYMSVKPTKDKLVVVVKGRKVPLGTVGKVFWTGDSKGGRRVGFTTKEGDKFFTAETNVEVVEPDQYIPTAEKIAAEAYHLSCQTKEYGNWHSYYAVPGYLQF